MRGAVEAIDDQALMNTDEIAYIGYLAGEYYIEPVVIDFDGERVSEREGSVRGAILPPDADVLRERMYKRQIIRFHLPFSGNEVLLQCAPDTFGSYGIPEINVDQKSSEIFFEVINTSDDTEGMKREKGRIFLAIRKVYDRVVKKVDEYNSSLEELARNEIKGRKQQILARSEFIESLGVPIKRSSNTPQSLAVPITKRKRRIQKPPSGGSKFVPEPAVDEDTYQEIVEICQELGVVIERHPTLYEGKDEEGLRDYFLMALSPQFEFAGGETFNKKGKTDILVRHQGKNAFVAECKFWDGKKAYMEAIDQLLGYLTWRDSKAALICFIRRKQLTPVLDQIRDKTSDHPCHVKSKSSEREGRYDFHFHLLEDETRGVRLAVLCFHFPKPPSSSTPRKPN